MVTRSGGTTTIGPFPINSNIQHSIEVSWTQGAAVRPVLTVDGAPHSLAGATTINTNLAGNTVSAVQLGPQGAAAGVNGSEYFDSFVSTHTTAIGQ